MATAGALVVALDRWGRVLLRRRAADLPGDPHPGSWGLPGGPLGSSEAPDEAAVREFEEATGHLLDRIRLFRVYRREIDLPSALVDVQHVYYDDPDLDLANIQAGEGEEFLYSTVAELPLDEMRPPDRVIAEDFVRSAAYRAMFH